jgi:putative DNA primase/helicase
VPAGVDIKGFRSVLVVPPTPGYSWLPSLEFGTAIPSEPPARFLTLLNGSSPKRKPRTKIPAGPIPPGQAHQAMLSAIGKLGRDRSLSSDELWTLARGMNADQGNRVPHDELRRMVEHVVAGEASHDPARYFTREDGFVPATLGREVKEAGRLRVGADRRLWHYRAGVYRPEGDDFVREFARGRLGDKFKRRHVEEVLSWCAAEFPSIPEQPDTSVLNLANGLLDWRTGDLRPHDPEFPGIVQLPAHWDPVARCPGIDRFLSEVLPEDAVDLFVELAGYCLLPAQPFRRAVLLLGSGGNGKSVALSLLRALLGRENVATIPLQTLGESRFAAAELYGKLANICSDLDARALRRSDTFKTLTGGTDAITAERKYRDPFSFVPFATLVFSANEAPASGDQTDAYFDRWVILPFENRFDEDGGGARPADPHLATKLTTPEELSGFLLRAVDGLWNLMDRGRFDLPASVRAAGQEYRERVDTLVSFLEDACVTGPDAKVRRSRLYESYREWCARNGRFAMSQQTFAPRLRKHLAGRIEEGWDHEERVWLGVGVRA